MESWLGLWLHPQDPVHMLTDCHAAEPHKGCCWLLFMSVMHGQGQSKDKYLAAGLQHPSYSRDHKECSSVPIVYPWLDQRLGSRAILHTVTVTHAVSSHLLLLVTLSSTTAAQSILLDWFSCIYTPLFAFAEYACLPSCALLQKIKYY